MRSSSPMDTSTSLQMIQTGAVSSRRDHLTISASFLMTLMNEGAAAGRSTTRPFYIPKKGHHDAFSGSRLTRSRSASFSASARSFFSLAAVIACSIAGCATCRSTAWGARRFVRPLPRDYAGFYPGAFRTSRFASRNYEMFLFPG